MHFREFALPCLLSIATALPAAATPQAPIDDVFNPAPGTSEIVYVVPEGTRVAKGQLVCLLAVDGLRPGSEGRRVATKQAEAAYAQATLNREIAELAVKEYEVGTFKAQLETIRGEVALAEADLSRAEARLAWSKDMAGRKYISPAQLLSDELSTRKARFAVEQGRTKMQVLETYTKSKTMKELQAEVEKARADELSKRATFELEKAREQKRGPGTRTIKVFAPADGEVRLARPARLVEEGAEVVEGQLLLRLFPGSR